MRSRTARPGAFVVAVVTLVTLRTSPASAQTIAPATRAQLDEANRAFTYRGTAINPRAIQDLEGWLSDSEPAVVTIDLAGTYKSNRYFGEYTRQADGSVVIDLRTAELNPRDDERYGTFTYKRLGTLPGGIHVLETWDSGGGPAVFTHLLLVRFEAQFEYDEHGKRKDQVVIRRMGEIVLGDRYRGIVTVQGNTVRITAGGAFPQGAVIRFE
jgi:hypothetical protein